MAANQPPYSLSPTEFDKAHDVNPPTNTYHSYSYPGMVEHSPLPYASSLAKSPNSYSSGSTEWSAGSPKGLEYGVEYPPTPELWSPKESKYEVMHPPLSDAGSPKKPASSIETPEEPASPGAETPKQPEDGMALGPPPSPALTNPNLPLDHQASSTGTNSQPVNLLDAINALKGKAKVSGTARDVGNAAC
jgi:hypothetical protein